MNEDDKLALDESNRAAQHESLKNQVRRDVQAEIARQARPETDYRRDEAAEVGSRLQQKAITEVHSTEMEIERARAAARISQFVDYVFYVIYGLIGLETVLEMVGARESNAFKNLIDTVTWPLLAPFATLVPDLSRGRFQLKLSYIIALIIYILLHLAINGLLRMAAHRKTAV
jgi:uncharacterized protein YggT (Ycf19 family)